MQQDSRQANTGNSTGRTRIGSTGAWTGFLVVAFGVVGLIGAMATFAAQIPFDRALSRSQALDQAVAISAQTGSPAALETLRPLLGDSAGRVLPGAGELAAHAAGDIAVRAARERTRMLGELHAEAADYGFRLRFVIAAFTAAAALFGCMVLSIVGQTRPR